MKETLQKVSFVVLLILSISLFKVGCSRKHETLKKFSEPKVIHYNPYTSKYQPILDGETDSVGFYSGIVTIEPNKYGETHSTEIYEEIIVVFEGEGKIKINETGELNIKFGKVAYIPPNTKHQVFNTGTKNLKYIYIATKSMKK